MPATSRQSKSRRRTLQEQRRRQRSSVRRNPAAKAVRPARARDWIGAARLRTLPLAVAPVALGTGAAVVQTGVWHEYRALLCLAVALLLQIGVNFANDYSDGVRGTDAVRVGPSRLTGSGAAKPRAVLTVALVCFALAAVAGLVLVVLSQQWWLLAVGALAVAAAWFYTGGKRPYGYAGLGEVAVFVFFGLVATVGTTFVQVGAVNWEAWLSAVAIGAVSCAALVVNNLRDIEGDRVAGKRTLAVRMGARGTRILYMVLIVVPFANLVVWSLFYPLAYLVFFTGLIAVPAVLIVLTARTAKELVLALGLTGLFGFFYGLGLTAAFVL